MLTAKQKRVLDFVKKHNDTHGHTPTLRIIADEMGISSISTAHQHIRALVQKKYLLQDENYGGLEIPVEKKILQNIPVLGYIAGGSPITVIEDSQPQHIFVSDIPNHGDFYALIVKGDSMIDDGIYDGDTVVIKKQNSAENGQTVVAIVDDENATLKKLYRVKGGYELRPANQNVLPLFREEVEVRGVVWEVRRNYAKPVTSQKTNNLRTLDLFAGIGGIRKGFEKAGFETVFANDFEKACQKTYDLNFKDSKLVVEDITKIVVEDLPEFDFILGGFPCQAFSIAGHRHGFNDQKGRGNLFFDIARMIEERMPTGFLLENVKNLRSHDGGKTFEIIKNTLENLGYKTKTKVLNSMEYGNVPQNRERIYIVGFKDHSKTVAFEFPDKVPLTKKVTDFLESDVDDKYYYNGKPLFEKLKDTVNEKGQVYQWRRQYVRKNKKGVCPTLTANMGMGGHNVPIIFDGKGIRKLTPRECIRLQGFPDSYKLPTDLPDSALYKQVGNSVSIPVIERIAIQMKSVL